MKQFFHSKKKIIIASSIVVVLVVIGLVVFFLWKADADSRLAKNASFQGISLSRMKQEEVTELVNQQINPDLQNRTITVSFGEAQKQLTLKDYDFTYDPETFFQEAKEFDFSEEEEFHPTYTYDKDKLAEDLEQFKGESRTATTPYQYEQTADSVIVRAGTPGKEFETETALAAVIDAVDSETDTVSLEGVDWTDDTITINLQAVHDAITVEVRDAAYQLDNNGALTYTDEQTGVTFDMEAAQQIVTDPNNGEYTIPLVTTQPQVTVAQLKEQMRNRECPDLLKSYTTYYSANDAGRNFNIAKAAAALNGTVILPGEEFSFNKIVGNTGKADGYKQATVYTANGAETGYGGGVCQVSTTMYMAAIYANMDITYRNNHRYTVGYVPLGQDAMVSDGPADFKFKNTRKDPIKIVTSTTNTSITISIYGTASDDDNYVVTLSPKVISTTPATVREVQNPNLPAGQKVVKSSGKEGCVVHVTKTVTYNGQVVSTSIIKSNYQPMPKVVEVGTGAA